MGEIADMMLNGDLDEETGEYIGPGDGYPRSPSRTARERAERAAQLAPELSKADAKLGFVQRSAWHWQVKIGSDLLDYWPSRNKWRFRDQTVKGSRSELVKVINAARAQTNNPNT